MVQRRLRVLARVDPELVVGRVAIVEGAHRERVGVVAQSVTVAVGVLGRIVRKVIEDIGRAVVVGINDVAAIVDDLISTSVGEVTDDLRQPISTDHSTADDRIGVTVFGP